VKDTFPLPAAPPGLLDVTESLVIGEGHVDEWFNELRAIEAEVRDFSIHGRSRIDT
jgi:hypothetical protein